MLLEIFSPPCQFGPAQENLTCEYELIIFCTIISIELIITNNYSIIYIYITLTRKNNLVLILIVLLHTYLLYSGYFKTII